MLIPNFVETWEVLHPREIFESVNNAEKPQHSIFWMIHNEIRPADLFCYLGARFGPPNGIQNFLRNDDSDNLIHWDWTLRIAGGHIMFLGLNFRTDVMIGTSMNVDDADKDDLIRQIKADFRNYGAGMTKIRNFLEPWVEFVNPYQRLRNSVDQLLEQLDALALDPGVDALHDPFENISPEEGKARWGSVSKRYSQGVGLCFGIRSMLPVLAESFVKILYVLMLPDLKKDDRLRENAFRQHIDIRIKSLAFTCIGFERPVDYSAEPCARYNTLVNERNDLLHGNVVIDKLRFNDLYFWDKVPVFKQYRSMWQRSIGVEVQAVGLDRVANEVAVVNEFIEYVLSCLHEEVRLDVQRMLEQRDLGYNTATGRVGVLFPGWLVDMQPVFRTDEGLADHSS